MAEQQERHERLLAVYAGGISPMDALKYAPDISTRIMAHTIYTALKSGTLIAIAGKGIETLGNRRTEQAPVQIQAALWEHAQHVNADYAAFWKTGHATIEIMSDERALYFYNVRFDPDGLAEIFPKSENVTAKGGTPETEEEEDGSKPSVSAAHLEAWFGVFKKAYGGTALDTLKTAMQSAKGMFPDKSVTRARIRKLRGEQTPGRKAKTDRDGQ